MIIDSTFFQSGLLLIKGIYKLEIGSSLTSESINDDLEWYIARYEHEYLVRLLGESAAFEFIEYLNKDESEPISKWDDLRSHLVVKIEGSIILCPAANYIYYYYLRAHQSDATITGVKVDNDNGVLVSADFKMKEAWNEMVRMNRRVCEWMSSCNDIYKDVTTDKSLLRYINTLNL